MTVPGAEDAAVGSAAGDLPDRESYQDDPEEEDGQHEPNLAILRAASTILRDSLPSDDPASARSMRIHAGKVALQFLPDGAERAKILERLARALYEHSQALNDWAALEESLDYLGQALEATDIKSDYARLGVFYSECLGKRYVRSRNSEDLNNAIEFAEKSTDLIFELRDGEEKFSLLASAILNHWLCVFLKLEFDNPSDPDDVFNLLMDLAVKVDRLIVNHKMEGSPLAAAKTNLGKSYEMKWERSNRDKGSFDDLISGVALAREAAALAANDEPSNRVSALANLAHRLQKAYLAFVVHGLLPPGNVLDGPSHTLAFVMYIREFPVEHRAEMLGGCEQLLRTSVATLRELWAISSVNDQQDTIATFYGISRYAAASAIQNNGDAFDALLLLEAGRGLALASQCQELQEMSAIQAVDSQLAERYEIAQRAFKDALKGGAPYHERRQNIQRLDELRQKIDSIPGIVRPALSLTRDNVLSLASKRDVVIINITEIRSDAIVISRGEIFVVNLPNINEEDLSERSWEIQTRLAKEKNQEEVFPELHQNLLAFFVLLWKNLTRPVLGRLGYTTSVSASECWPHICWIPSGVLCLYPLHAAGLGLHKESNVMNRAVSSYASSLTSLWNLRRRRQPNSQPSNPEDCQACVFSSPETPGMQPLELSAQEVGAVRSIFPNTTTLTGQPTQNILSAMATEPVLLHFSCHGEVDYDHPLQSRLLTADWQTDPLTVGRIQLLNLRKPLLAYLSACFTANAGVENQQDESIHLAGALQHAGFPNVVGAAWYVGEDASLSVVRRFYLRLGRSLSAGASDWDTVVADALHFAVRDFSETTRTAANRGRGDPVRWAPFMMLGR